MLALEIREIKYHLACCYLKANGKMKIQLQLFRYETFLKVLLFFGQEYEINLFILKYQSPFFDYERQMKENSPYEGVMLEL